MSRAKRVRSVAKWHGNLHGYSGLLIDILKYNINNKVNINMFNCKYLE